MGKLRQAALILGEGPTEFFYFKSLCDVFKRLTIKPDYPKHTNIKELDAKIAEGVAMGYRSMPSPSTNQRKVYTVRWSFSRLTAAPSCFFSIISVTPRVCTMSRNHCSKISIYVSSIGRR